MSAVRRLYCAGPMSAVSFCAATARDECRQRPPWTSDDECPVHRDGAPEPWDFAYPLFNEAAARLEAVGFVVENPTLGRVSPAEDEPGLTWSDYLRRALVQMLRADGVATLPGWENSRGAQLEVHVAETLRMPVAPVEDWLEAAQA